MGVVGSGSSHNVQLEAGIREANLLIAVTGSDEAEPAVLLSDRQKAGNGCQTIARVRNPDYSQEVRFIREGNSVWRWSSIRNRRAASEMARISFPICHQDRDFTKRTLSFLRFRIGQTLF